MTVKQYPNCEREQGNQASYREEKPGFQLLLKPGEREVQGEEASTEEENENKRKDDFPIKKKGNLTLSKLIWGGEGF